MRSLTIPRTPLWLPVVLLAFLAACDRTPDAQAGADSASAEMSGAEIPVTTASDEARELFLEGRTMSENLRALDARPLLEEAVAKDPSFAYAYLLLANTAPSPEEFFENL